MKSPESEETVDLLELRRAVTDSFPPRVNPPVKVPKIRLGSERSQNGPPPGAHPSVELGTDRRGNPAWKRAGRPKRSPGRPVKYANKFDMVRDAAMVGLTLEQIGFILGFTPKKWQVRCAAEPGLGQAFKEGKTGGMLKISQVAYKKAAEGDNFCIQLYLRCIAGWKETSRLELSSDQEAEDSARQFDIDHGRKVAAAYLNATDAVVVKNAEVKQIVSRENPQKAAQEPGVRPQELLPKDTATVKDGLTRPGVEEGVGVTIPAHEEN